MTETPLRQALAGNLTFSALCGLALLIDGPGIAAAIGALPGWVMTGLGFGLLGFALAIGLVLAHLRVGWALAITALDALWVVATLPLIAVPDLLTAQGKAVVASVAAVVALFGFLQARGIRLRLASGAEDGTYRHCVRLTTEAEPATLWAAIRDLGGIARYSDTLASSKLLDGAVPGPGAVRQCTNRQGQSWREEVISLDDGARQMALRFRTEAPDFPFPFAQMVGGWSVSGATGGGASVEIWWTIRPSRRFGWLVLALMTLPLDRDIRRLVAAMSGGKAARPGRPVGPLPALSAC